MVKWVFVRGICCDVFGILCVLCCMLVVDVVGIYMCVLMGVGNFVLWDLDFVFYVIELMNCLVLCEYDVVVFVGLV